MRIIYLYGFVSGPQSDKAQFFQKKFAATAISFDIFDYIPNKESFMNLRTSVLIENLHSYIQLNYFEDDIILFGSSFGAFLSAWYASKYPERIKKLILMAPALRFSASFICNAHGITLSSWKKQGFVAIPHYRFNREIPLNYTFYEDLLVNPPPDFANIEISIPTLIFHGRSDEVIPVVWSQHFAEINQRVSLHVLDGDHQLLDQKEVMWLLIKEFLEEEFVKT